MKSVRDLAYVLLINLAARVATSQTREIHNEVIERGMKAYGDALDARINRGGAS